jgi:hypothetical protein
MLVEKTLALPDGGTALIPCGTVVVEGRNEFGPPVLSKIPYVNRLFKNVGVGREERQLMMLVTARVLRCEEEKQGCVGSACAVVIGKGVNSDCCATGNVVVNERNCETVKQAAHSECAKCPEAAGSPACYKGTLSLADVAELSAAKVSDDIIINQVLTTGTYYTLDAKAILWLKKHGVSDAVVLQMQHTGARTQPELSGSTSYRVPDANLERVELNSDAMSDVFVVVADALAKSLGLLPDGVHLFNVYDPTPRERMMQLLNESEDLREKNRSSTLGYERLKGAIGP